MRKKTPTVLCFGTFDGLHPGHEFFLRKASAFGKLSVVLARDATVEKYKKKKPFNNEKARLAAVNALPYVTNARFGYTIADKLKVVQEINPDIIVLGYDQSWFVDELKAWATKQHKEIILLPAHVPEKYKTSILHAKKT